MTDTAQPKHATDRNIGEVSFRTGLTAARINVVCCWTSYFWILLFSVHIKGRFWMSLERFMYVRAISSILCMTKRKGLSSLHLSSQEFQNSTIGYARIQGIFILTCSLVFQGTWGVGCFSFPKFFLPWYVCFWRNSSSLTLGMFDQWIVFARPKVLRVPLEQKHDLYDSF